MYQLPHGKIPPLDLLHRIKWIEALHRLWESTLVHGRMITGTDVSHIYLEIVEGTVEATLWAMRLSPHHLGSLQGEMATLVCRMICNSGQMIIWALERLSKITVFAGASSESPGSV